MVTLTISTSDLQKMLNTENSDVVLLTKRGIEINEQRNNKEKTD